MLTGNLREILEHLASEPPDPRIRFNMLADLEQYMPFTTVDPGPVRIERIDEARLRDRLATWVASKRAVDRRDLSAGEMLEEIEGLLGEE